MIRFILVCIVVIGYLILSIPILLRYNGQRGASPRWNTAMKWLFYLYYPAHLFLIGWLQWRA